MKNGWIRAEAFRVNIHYVNDLKHKDDGPAAVHDNGAVGWYKNDFLHREDGPAWIEKDDYKQWWYNGVWLYNITNNEEFLNWVKFKAFM